MHAETCSAPAPHHDACLILRVEGLPYVVRARHMPANLASFRARSLLWRSDWRFGVIAKAEGAESMDVPGFVAAQQSSL